MIIYIDFKQKVKQTTSIYLPGLRCKVEVHPGVCLEDLGATGIIEWGDKNGTIESWGECRGEYIPGESKYKITLMQRPDLDCYHSTFVQGHEEGHAVQYLGKLIQLHELASALGYQFNFLTEKICSRNDESAFRFHHRINSASDFDEVWRRPFLLKESIANIGGLVALVKADKFDEDAISKVYGKICEQQLNPLSEL